jgi:hypothetical protein
MSNKDADEEETIFLTEEERRTLPSYARDCLISERLRDPYCNRYCRERYERRK